MALYMLDTDSVSYLLKGSHPKLDAKVASTPPNQLCISAVTKGELMYGLNLKQGAHRLAKVIDQFLIRIQCLPWDERCATSFAEIAAQLHLSGTQIGSMDAMIAGHALALDAVLVTNNKRHFSRISALRVESWN
jgi:tRNA(fMet)-specific endonuclease VapC